MDKEERKQFIDEMKEVFATKADLSPFATKADLSKFATAEDHVNLEEKVDTLTEITNSIKEDIVALKVHLYDAPKRERPSILEKEHVKMKEIIEERLGVKV